MKRHLARPGTRWIMGKNPIKELLTVDPGRIKRVYTSKAHDKEPIFDELEAAGIEVVFVHRDELSNRVESDSHQGFVAHVKEPKPVQLKEFLKEEREASRVLLVDSIFDPHNLGAILRAAECFDVDALITSKNRGVGITPSVTKSSAGASELVTTITVSNLAESVQRLQDEGYTVVTAEVGEGAVSLYDYSFPEKCALVMGSEGKGVQKLISKRADQKLYIPMLGQIDSLNVSQAVAVILSHWRKA